MSDERFGLQVPPHERRPVAWYAPAGLRRVAREQLWSMNLIRNLDRREGWSGPIDVAPLSGLTGAQGDFWFDFIADTGDGGNATTAVAQGALAARLTATGHDGRPVTLPEGQLLVLGGDLAYPGASPETYQSRLVEMFELARDGRSRFEDAPAGLAREAPFEPGHKLVAAIPQNHDWFDSASTFCRYFVHPEKAGLVGARAPQHRTYFALHLPHDWLLLGVDFALTGDLDRAQFEAFAELAQPGRLPRGTQVVLVYPEPTWTRALGDGSPAAYPRRYQRLEHLLTQAGLPIRARIAGDLHHYVRERLAQGPDGRSTDLITCGSGGAFGHSTHSREVSDPKFLDHGEVADAVQAELRGRVYVGRNSHGALPPQPGMARLGPFEPQSVYPDAATSRRLARANWRALLDWREGPVLKANLSFALAAGSLLALGLVLPLPLAWLLAAPLALALFLAGTENDPARAPWRQRLPAALAAGAVLALAWQAHSHLQPWLTTLWPSAWPTSAAQWASTLSLSAAGIIVGGMAGVLLAALTLGGYLAIASLWAGDLINNASSPLAHEDHKGFLRVRVHAGGLEVFMLGIDRVPRHWQPASDPGARPYWRPAEGEPALAWRIVDHFHISR